MSQGASPSPAQDGPGLSAGTNDQTTHGSSQKESSHFEHPLSKRETPGGFAFEMSDTFLTPLAVVCPVTKVGAVKSKPLILAVPEEARGKLQKYQEFYAGSMAATGLSIYPKMKSWYHESGDSIMEAINEVAMSDEAKEYLMSGPCGIRKHAYLFSMMQAHPDEFECDAGTQTDCEIAPWNQIVYRRYVLDNGGYCVNLNGGIYHSAYGGASKNNMEKWMLGSCTIQQLLAPPEAQPSPAMDLEDTRKRRRMFEGETNDGSANEGESLAERDLSQVFLGTNTMADFKTAMNEGQYETATKMFEATLSEGKLYAGRFARLQKQTSELNETVFGLKVDGDRLRELMGDQNKGWQSKCDSLKQTMIDKDAEVSWARCQMESALQNNRDLTAKAEMHADQLRNVKKNAASAATEAHNTFKAELCGVMRRHGMESLVQPSFNAAPPEPPAPGMMSPSNPPNAENATQWIQYINGCIKVPEKVMAEFLNATNCMTCKILKGKCFYCGGPVTDAAGHGNFKHADGTQKGTLVSECLSSPMKSGTQCSVCVRHGVRMSTHSVDACLFDMQKLRQIVNHKDFVERVSEPQQSQGKGNSSQRSNRGHSNNPNNARPQNGQRWTGGHDGKGGYRSNDRNNSSNWRN